MADGYLNFDTKINEKGFNEGISKLGKLGKAGLGVAAKGITAITTAAGTAIGASIKVGAAFEAEMSKVSSISGATGDDLQKLTAKAKEMGAKTKFSATESAQAMEYMAMAGWKTGDMLSGIEGIMNLAAASGENLATTSDIVTDALTAFGLKASDSSHFADILAKASSNANTNVSLMGETFKYVAPVAGALKFSAEDCAVAIGLMANSGIKASQAGTSLRQLFTNLVKPTDAMQAAMTKLGISITDSYGKTKSLDTVMGDLRNSFSGLTESEKAQYAATLAGQEGMSGLLAIVNASDKDFKELRKSIYNCDGAAADMAATMQDNLKGQITILKSEAEGLGIEIYESIEKPLKSLASVGVKALGELNTAWASGGFIGAINQIGKTIPQLKSVTDVIADLSTKISAMNSDQLMSLGKTAVVLAGAVPVLKQFGSVSGAATAALDMIGGSAGKAVLGLKKLPAGSKEVTKSLTSLGKDIKGVGNALLIPFEGIGEKIGGVFGKINYRVGYYGAGIKNQIVKLASPLSGALGKIVEPFNKIGTAIGTSLGNVGTKISGYAGIIADSFKPILARVATFAPTFFKLINIGAGAAIIVAGMGLIYSQFGAQIDQLLLLMQTKGPEVITNFGAGITAAIPGLVAQGAALILGIVNAITANLPSLIAVGADIISTLVSSLAAQLPQLIPAAAEMILTLVESLISNLPKIISSGLKLMEGLAQGIANSIPIVAAKAPVIIGRLASTIITNLPKIIQTGVKIITQLAVGLVQGIPALLSKIPSMISQIKNAFTSVNWGSVGINIITGIASGISSAVGNLISAATSAASSALDAIKKKLGIHSPSRVFRDQVGKMMALGMGIGFEKNIPVGSMSSGVEKAVRSLQRSVQLTTSVDPDRTVGSVKDNPVYKDSGFDYDRFERIQRKVAKESGNKPIFLDTKRIDRPLPKGAVPQV